jgi:prepilin-type N-terminal cleavage/methylation domain-containing protein
MKNFFTKSRKIINQSSRENKNLASGFTLVETLLALSIFSIAITGLISVSSRGVNDTNFVKNKMIASHLAAEGIELVRNMRDEMVMSVYESGVGVDNFWNNFIFGNPPGIVDCYDPNGNRSCYMDAFSVLPTTCNNNNCPKLRYDPGTGYGYAGSLETSFTRTIRVFNVPGGANEEVIVDSVVTWNQGSNIHSASYRYNLFNWIY